MTERNSPEAGNSATDDLPPLLDHYSSKGLPHDESLEAGSHEIFLANEAARNAMRLARARELRRRSYRRRKAAKAAISAQVTADGKQGWYTYEPGLPGLARHVAKGNVHAPTPEDLAAPEESLEVHGLIMPEIKMPPLTSFVDFTSIAECTDDLIGVPFEKAIIASTHGDNAVPFARLFNHVSDAFGNDIEDLVIISKQILEDQNDRLMDHVEREFGKAYETQFAERQAHLTANHEMDIRRLTTETLKLRRENRILGLRRSNHETDLEQDALVGEEDDEDMDDRESLSSRKPETTTLSSPESRRSQNTFNATRSRRSRLSNSAFIDADD